VIHENTNIKGGKWMKNENRIIPFSPPDISELEIQEVAEALRSGWITTGPRTKQLEKILPSGSAWKNASV
jgi:dTDP-4-amino-4,6-dideoxygalactose transaminase